MKLLQATLAAALAVSGLGIGGAALAQGMMHQGGNAGEHMQGGGNDHRGDVNDNRGHDDHRGGMNNNRGHHNGWRNNRGHQVCSNVWRHHHRQRVCRWVR